MRAIASRIRQGDIVFIRNAPLICREIEYKNASGRHPFVIMGLSAKPESKIEHMSIRAHTQFLIERDCAACNEGTTGSMLTKPCDAHV